MYLWCKNSELTGVLKKKFCTRYSEAMLNMTDETSLHMDQVPCGSVLVTKKLVKNGKVYLELSRRRVKVCMFQKEWENFKNSRDIIDIGLKYELYKEKFLKPHNGQIYLYLANGFKFSLSSDDYYQIMSNSVFVDDVKPLDKPNMLKRPSILTLALLIIGR